MVSANDRGAAEKIAADLVWRLDVLQHRCRYNVRTGKYRNLPTRIRRFSNACPTDIVADVLDALIRMAPYTRVVFNGEDDPEVRYRPTMTMIKKDDSLKSTEGSKGTYTIVQDLLLEGEIDLFMHGDASSCSRAVTATRYWDEAEVMDCPQGGQGVVYQVTDVVRDKETDLFSFTVKETRAITQHLPETVTECDDDKTVTVETWDNVYTDDTGAERTYRWDDVVHDGSAIGLPAPCDHEDGTLVKIDVSENDDCTLKIQVTRTTSKPEEYAEYLRYRDQFLKRDMDFHKAVAPVPGDRSGVEYDPAAGTKTTVEVKSNEDGTVDRRVTVDTERAVQNYEYSETVMPRFTEKSWTDRFQLSPAAGLPPEFAYGTWKFTKTEAGRYHNTYTGHVPIASTIGYQCDDTAFLHTHSENRTLAAYPDPEECVPVAGGGVVTAYDVRKDDQGNITKVTQRKTEHEYPAYRRTVSSTLLGKIVRVYDKSMASILGDPADGTVATVEYQVTDGRLFDRVQETFVLNNDEIELAANCRKTVFEHVQAGEKTATAMGGHTSDAGVRPDQYTSGAPLRGWHSQTHFVKDVNTGAIRRQVEETVEIPFQDAVVEKHRTLRGTLVKVTHRNQTVTAAQLLGLDKSVGQQESRSTNLGGSVDQTLTYYVPNAGADLQASCSLTITRHRHETETVLEDGAAVEAGSGVVKAGGGLCVKETVQSDENGIATKKVETTKELDRVFGSRVHEDALQAHQVIEETSARKNLGDADGEGTEFPDGHATHPNAGAEGAASNLADGVASPFDASRTDAGLGDNTFPNGPKGYLGEWITTGKLVPGGGFERGLQYVADSELTDGGRYHTKKYKYVPKPQKWLDAALENTTGGHYTWNFRNLTQEQVKELVIDACAVAGGAENRTGKFFGSFKNCPFIRRVLNDFGLYDGSCGFESRAVTGSGSSSQATTDYIDTIATWREVDVKVVPVVAEDVDLDGFAAYVTTTTSDWVLKVGKGRTKINNSTFYGTPSIQFDPLSERFTIRACTGVTTKTEYIEKVGSGAEITVKPKT